MTDSSFASVPGGPAPGERSQGQIWPCLQAYDAPALIAFLEALGFVRSAVYFQGETFVEHGELAWPEGGAVMLSSHKANATWSLTPGSAGINVYTQDPDGVHAKAVAAGGDIIQPLTDAEYGGRGFSVRDPEGNLWHFTSYPGEA